MRCSTSAGPSRGLRCQGHLSRIRDGGWPDKRARVLPSAALRHGRGRSRHRSRRGRHDGGGQAGRRGRRVVLVDHWRRIGERIRVSGAGAATSRTGEPGPSITCPGTPGSASRPWPASRPPGSSRCWSDAGFPTTRKTTASSSVIGLRRTSSGCSGVNATTRVCDSFTVRRHPRRTPAGGRPPGTAAGSGAIHRSVGPRRLAV